MDKKSGVYYYLIDNSLRAIGSSTFGGIVPMYTTKGELGKLNRVSARDYREKLGFDLEYNPNYMGLDKMLSSVSFIEVLRCNKNPTVAYKIWDVTGSPYSKIDLGSADAVEDAAPPNSVWVSCTSPGSWGNNFYVCFSVDASGSSPVYTLHHYSVTRGVSSLSKKYNFSLDEESDIYYKKVYFGDLIFGFNGAFPSSGTFFVDLSSGLPQGEDYHLNQGDNGTKFDSSLDVTEFFHAIDESATNVVVMNGFIETPVSSVGLIRSIMDYCGKQDRSVFLDSPVLVDPGSDILRANEYLYQWATSLLDANVGQYAQVAAVPDLVSSGGLSIQIQPSVNLFTIYANMFSLYGHVNFPPAGNTYGSVSVNSLMKSDFHLNGDELKTNRINYITKTSKGVCMWEYRTLYSLGGSDLSYANTPFILRDLKGRLIDYMENFNFRYTTPVDLLSIQSGLGSILDDFAQNFFIVKYTLNVPTYEEAQKAGREVDIDIAVAVINSADVINLRVTLQNASNI